MSVGVPGSRELISVSPGCRSRLSERCSSSTAPRAARGAAVLALHAARSISWVVRNDGVFVLSTGKRGYGGGNYTACIRLSR